MVALFGAAFGIALTSEKGFFFAVDLEFKFYFIFH